MTMSNRKTIKRLCRFFSYHITIYLKHMVCVPLLHTRKSLSLSLSLSLSMVKKKMFQIEIDKSVKSQQKVDLNLFFCELHELHLFSK